MAAARAEAEAGRKLVASEASHLESRAASVQAEAAAATEQRISLAARLRDVEQREVGGCGAGRACTSCRAAACRRQWQQHPPGAASCCLARVPCCHVAWVQAARV